ncbi:MAG TPA: LacI family DNA-binding transcriptional regulator [Ktedonobacteraceae bacterium]|jgi:LacI family transcriptional regulator|nr:LacI family DNA-binding transcriptional regulator [Ktedonobacteraceae bacterium]
MSGRPTIDDIARLAGVSKATVSRVLNHKPDVDPATRDRILRIVEEQGFIRSIAASGLAGGRSRLIGVLIPSFAWPLIPDIMNGVAEVIGETDYELVTYSINDRIRRNNHVDIIDRILATKLTAGLLAIYSAQPPQHLARLHRQDFPVVVIDDQDPPPNVPWVGIDNKAAGYAATRHLIQLGHRRIAHIQGPMQLLCSHERYEGYCQALQDAGLPLLPDLVLEGNFAPTGGRACARILFSMPPERRPTAIFAANDQTAYGVLAAAEENGIHIPHDVALVGFDDLASTTAHIDIRPELTTIRQPFYEMGQRSIELLLSLLEKPRFPAYENRWRYSADSTGRGSHIDEEKPPRIYLPASLVVRASCGSPHPLTIPLPPLDSSA